METSSARYAAFREIVRRELKKCSKCGACASVCPLYGEKKSEASCVRGKLRLAKAVLEDECGLSPRIAAIFNDCLFCLACRENCPGGVRMDYVLLAARSLLAEANMQSKLKSFLFERMLPHKEVMDCSVKLAGVIQSMAFRAIPESSGLRLRLPVRFPLEGFPVPRLTSRPFRSRFPETVTARNRMKGSVMYFSGCAANYIYPSIGEAIVYLLTALGYDVIIPPAQACCGTPALVSGLTSRMDLLMRANALAFGRGTMPIITSCGSCGLMLKEHYPELVPRELRGLAQNISRRVSDISMFLEQEALAGKLKPLLRRTTANAVTYHDPCHLSRGLQIRHAPRSLLRLIAPDFAEMKDAGRCCGSGGTWGITHFEASRGILHKKMQSVAGTKAPVIATGCPACIMQLEGGLALEGMRGAAVHTAELLAWAAGYEPGSHADLTRFMFMEGRT